MPVDRLIARCYSGLVSFYVYILECSDGSYYTGHTDDLERRMAAHDMGHYPGYTQKRRPVRLAFCDEFPTRQEAYERERQIKGWNKAKKKLLIDKNWDELAHWSKRQRDGPFDSATLRVSGGVFPIAHRETSGAASFE